MPGLTGRSADSASLKMMEKAATERVNTAFHRAEELEKITLSSAVILCGANFIPFWSS